MDNNKQNTEFVETVRKYIAELETELTERNADIGVLDDYIYGDKLKKTLNIPVGHDKTPVNWLPICVAKRMRCASPPARVPA